MVAEAHPRSPTWVLHCLNEKCRDLKANEVFTSPKFLRMIAARMDDIGLLNIWRMNSKTAELFQNNENNRGRLLLELIAGTIPVVDAASLSAEDKNDLKQTLVINLMFSRLVTTKLINHWYQNEDVAKE